MRVLNWFLTVGCVLASWYCNTQGWQTGGVLTAAAALACIFVELAYRPDVVIDSANGRETLTKSGVAEATVQPGEVPVARLTDQEVDS